MSKPCENCGCDLKVCKDCDLYTGKYVKAELQAELEKIKAEIENMWIKSAKDLRTGRVIYENLCEHSEVLEIVDKHIAELKGESNE